MRSFCIAGVLLILLTTCSGISTEKSIQPGSYATESYLPALKGKRIGLVANHTSMINEKHLCDTLLELGIKITAIFSPEHGFSGKADAGELVGNEIFRSDSINIISLYGKNKKPSPADLKDIDIIIFDLQDVGVRFYTYLSSLHYVMEACAENEIPLIVLDRPNPLGFYIDGPVLNIRYSSFVGLHPVPIVTGMTIGEYARMINGEYWLKDSVRCSLTVIPCQNYTHDSLYILPVAPSPNLPGMESVYLYPSLGLFEGTMATVGKGTEYPFRIFGHPDFKKCSFSFIPRSRKGLPNRTLFEGQVCYGKDLQQIPSDTLKQIKQVKIKYLIEAYKCSDNSSTFFNSFFTNLAGTELLAEQIKNGINEKEIRKSWENDLNEYKKIRIKYLLYPDFKP